jgi:hypothetical protein
LLNREKEISALPDLQLSLASFGIDKKNPQFDRSYLVLSSLMQSELWRKAFLGSFGNRLDPNLKRIRSVIKPQATIPIILRIVVKKERQ